MLIAGIDIRVLNGEDELIVVDTPRDAPLAPPILSLIE